jgi:hypothetical protein
MLQFTDPCGTLQEFAALACDTLRGFDLLGHSFRSVLTAGNAEPSDARKIASSNAFLAKLVLKFRTSFSNDLPAANIGARTS